MIRKADVLSHRIVKTLPHAIDAVLLLSAIMLVVITEQYPFYYTWLTVKVVALLAYILLGMLAFKWAKTKASKVTYWLLALLTFAYIASVALTKTPLWFMPGSL